MKSISFLLLTFFGVSAGNSFAQTSADFDTDSITTNTLVASSFISDNEGWLADNTGILWHTGDAGES